MLTYDTLPLIRNSAGCGKLRLATALLRATGGRPQPAEIRVVRTFLSGVPDVPVRIYLSPPVCKNLAVVDTSYQVRLPDTYAPGSLFRGDQEVKNAMNPHIDVSVQQSDASDGRVFATHVPLEMTVDRLAGNQARIHTCDSCWIINWCDYLNWQFFLERALAASEVPLEVIVGVYGFGIGDYEKIDEAEARSELIEAGIIDTSAPITTGGG